MGRIYTRVQTIHNPVYWPSLKRQITRSTGEKPVPPDPPPPPPPQVMRDGASEILNKLYDTAMDKLEGLKRDYEALRKRYNEKTAQHNADLSRLEQAAEEKHLLQKQADALLKQRDAAVHYQQLYSMRRYTHTHTHTHTQREKGKRETGKM